jgi:hypothetical protein
MGCCKLYNDKCYMKNVINTTECIENSSTGLTLILLGPIESKAFSLNGG